MVHSPHVFSDKDLFEALQSSQQYGFLSPKPLAGQILHSKEFISMFPEHDGQALDLGAGGGLPCLVWLNLDSEVRITAVDSMSKRTNFLSDVREKNESIFERFDVINGRAEELAHRVDLRERFDIVVARGFGPPSTTAECASGFLKPGGKLVVSGRPENEILRWDKSSLAKLRLSLPEVREADHCHAAVFEKLSFLPKEFPRSASLMKKKPLW